MLLLSLRLKRWIFFFKLLILHHWHKKKFSKFSRIERNLSLAQAPNVPSLQCCRGGPLCFPWRSPSDFFCELFARSSFQSPTLITRLYSLEFSSGSQHLPRLIICFPTGSRRLIQYLPTLTSLPHVSSLPPMHSSCPLINKATHYFSKEFSIAASVLLFLLSCTPQRPFVFFIS